MPSFHADSAAPANRTRFHLVLAGLADELVGTLARLLAYVGALALLAMFALYAGNQLPSTGILDAAMADWSEALNPAPAFAASRTNSAATTAPYAARCQPEGGKELERGACELANAPDWFAAPGKAPLRGAL